MPAKKIFLFGFIVVLLIAIPFTVYLLGQQQEIRSRATAATTISLIPTGKTTNTTTVNAGDTFTLDVEIDPGTNIITLIQLHITYDPTKLSTASAANIGAGLVPDRTAVPVVLQSPTYTQNTITASFSPGADVSSFIQTKKKVATLVMKALAPATTTQIAFAKGPNQTDIRSTAAADQPSENVLQNANPANITINAAAIPPTATPVPGTPVPNQPPVCTALSVDRTASGAAPFPITFTASGNDPDGTIQKVTFSFGNGTVGDVDKNNQTNGIGTNSVNAQISHTYQNPGSFRATAVLTDNRNGISTTEKCTQTITVTQPVAVPTSSQSATPTPIVITATPASQVILATPTPIVIVTSTTPVPPGPGNTLLKIGGIGAILSIIGGILLFAL